MLATKSYSQQGEQEAILSVVPAQGRFLDIGAFHPTCFSNTRALYEIGWSGVMIEPSPGPFSALFAEYGKDPRISLVHAALGLERKLAEFWVTDDAVSTTEASQYEKWKNFANFTGKVYVPVITLEDILETFPGSYDFVNIDTEGTSIDLLADLLAGPYYPKCICVEYDDRREEALGLADEFGYRTILDNGTNLVIVK